MLPRWGSCFREKKLILVSENSEKSKSSRNLIFNKYNINIKLGKPVKQSQPFNRDFFMTIDARFVLLWDFEFFEKSTGSSIFRKIRAIILKLHTNTLYRSRNFGIEFGQNRSKRSNFFRFWLFSEFFQNCLTQANFDLSSWNFVRKHTNTEWCLILNFVKISQVL